MGQSPSENPFRSAVPAYQAPDRAQWKRNHGVEPRELTGVPSKFIFRANASLKHDVTALMKTEALTAHDSIADVCTEVQFACDCDETDVIAFDVDTQSFWAYPEKA